MAHWRRYWLMGTLVYCTPLAMLMADHPPYQGWSNALVVLGPPAVVYVLAWALWRAR
jgi:hypothetical protein